MADEPRRRIVAITGAASGIGRALAERFGRAGWHVGALDFDIDANERAVAALREQGIDATAIPCDVTRFDACQHAVELLIGTYGGIDVLINNAGVTHRSAFEQTDVSVFRRVMDVNYFGAIHMTKAALPALLERHGQIVVLSSIAGFAPLLGRTGYAGSKHAVQGLFSSLRTELAERGVGVTIVCPSFTATNIGRNALDGDGTPTSHPQSTTGRVATPAQVADAIFGAACARKRFVVPSPLGRLAWWISTLAPAYYERTMRKQLHGELER